MTLFFVASIAVKSITTAAIVLTASALARRAGPFWGAVAASLPVSVGPAYLFLALKHDPDFLEVTALNSAVASAGTAVFLCVFAFLAMRPLLVGFTLSVIAWVGVILSASWVDWTPATTLVLNTVAFGTAIWLTRGRQVNRAEQGTKAPPSFKDSLLQAICIAAFVALLVLGSSALGPELSGFVSVFPISLASVIVLLRGKISAVASGAIALAALRIMPSYPVAFVAMYLTIGTFGVISGLLLALVIIVLWAMAVAIFVGSPKS